HRHGRPARVRALALVGAPAAQPDRAADQGCVAVPPGHRRRQRPLPPRGTALMMRSMEDPKKETAPKVFGAAALMAARTGSVVWVVVPRGSGMVAQARAAADAAGVAVTTSISTASIQVRFSPSADERASGAEPPEE